MEPAELFRLLESNHAQSAEEMKLKLHDQFNNTKESWLLNLLVDYYISSGSIRCVEILVGVKEPHDKYLFDRLLDSLRNVPTSRLTILTLLGHVVNRQPTWLHKISQHSLMKEILKILKTETDILLLMSSLLILIVLLPMIPANVGPFLQEIFEVFSRLAAWNTNNPSKLPEEQLIHLQVSLHTLFHRLYGMYPCNFLSYLQNEYSARENLGIFSHTIKPMLETVKMHPLLVTASKDAETATYRWKSMEHHDVIVECAKFAVDMARDDGCNVKSTDCAVTLELPVTVLAIPEKHERSPTPPLQPLPPMQAVQESTAPTTIPHTSYVLTASFPHQEGTSPPEAAIEATPETTPVKDMRLYTSRTPNLNSTVARALNNFNNVSTTTTPNHSQASSPMKKEQSPFNFGIEDQQETSVSAVKLNRILQDRKNYKNAEHGMMLEVTKNGLKHESEELCETELNDEIKPMSAPKTPTLPFDAELHEDCKPDLNSPCTAGGLHMPNSKSLRDFHETVGRIRYFSHCADDPRSQSGGNLKSDEESCATVVRRTISCPEMKKEHGPVSMSSPAARLNEKDEEEVTNNVSTQTQTVEPLMLYPYGHMFLSVFPTNTANTQHKHSPNSLLDKYVTLAAQHYLDSEEHCGKKTMSPEQELKAVKDQLVLLHLQLKFERHRREVHAERNRRLLGKSRNNKYLEEHNTALREQLALLEKEIENVNSDVEKNKQEWRNEEMKLQDSIQHWQDNCTKLEKRNRELKTENDRLVNELRESKQLYLVSSKELQKVEAKLFEVGNEMKLVISQASAGEQFKSHIEYLQKELLVMGEIQERYMKTQGKHRSDSFLIQESFQEQIKSHIAMLDNKTTTIDAMRSRISELESMMTRRDVVVGEQKRTLKALKQEFQEQLKALEEKYECQRAINRKQEEHILELNNRLETTSKRNKQRCVSTAQDVLSLAEKGGLNSPLSLSLSSSEGLSISTCCVLGETVHMTDLRTIVDEGEISQNK